MKVILNKDLSTLGEEGDIREVAKGYARNYLFPRGIALPYTESTIKLFEARKDEIEARKAEKRKDAAGLREKIEALEVVITMPAGVNGKLYGAVTAQTVMEELAKQGYQIERKRIELPGNSFKSVGKYKVAVKLYESAAAELTITVQGQAIKVETKAAPPPGRNRRRQETAETKSSPDTGETPAEADAPLLEAQHAEDASGAAVAAEAVPPEGEASPAE
ncbi:50S ribosomal protein L9 [Spirochaetia bacterium]|nr:50S ribosomal protein L9 [Spirochaetia bacterium]